MVTFSQPVLLAISQMKEFEKFLTGPIDTGILMNLHLGLLPAMLRKARAAGKQVFIHSDLIHGLAADEYGCEYLCQALGCDGVISTKTKVLETAHRAHRTTILRLFLIDSKSLEKGISLIQSLHPDCVELLPGLAWEIVPEIKGRLSNVGIDDISFLCGGLLRTPDQITRCLRAGAGAVTLSDRKLAEEYLCQIRPDDCTP